MTVALRFRTTPTTSVVTVQPTGNKPKLSSKSGITQAQTRITAEDCKDPARLAKALQFLQTQISESTQALRSDPEIGAIVFVGLVVVSGRAFTITHNLGRPYMGYRVTRSYGGATSAISVYETSLPTGLTVSQAVTLVPSASGTCDVRVF